MSMSYVETPDERRKRYLRLAKAAADTAAKTPLPEVRELYLNLAQSWTTMADQDEPTEH
jgi:hypothetical protein